jgi:hypothetical protein
MILNLEEMQKLEEDIEREQVRDMIRGIEQEHERKEQQ